MPKLSFQLQQKLSINSRLLTSLNVLHLPQHQLHELVQSAIDTNPLLERTPADSPTPERADHSLKQSHEATEYSAQHVSTDSHNTSLEYQHDSIAHENQRTGSHDGADQWLTQLDLHEDNLQSHLMWQCEIGDYSPNILPGLHILIDDLDESGYLTHSLTTLSQTHSLSVTTLQKALHALQAMEPSGVGAQDLSECLALQLKSDYTHHPDQSIAYQLVSHLDLLATYPDSLVALSEIIECDVDRIEAAYRLIQQLSPKPGLQISQTRSDQITPDIVISEYNDRIVAKVVNQPAKLRINPDLLALAHHDHSESAAQTRTWINDLKAQAHDLIQAIEYRASTLERIADYLIEHQHDYFKHGLVALKPRQLNDAAEALSLHLSTLSRAVNQKYIHSPQGSETIRALFSTALPKQPTLTNRYAKQQIRQLILNEPLTQPLNDDNIAQALKKQGILLSRRTVSKYRMALQIPNSRERKHRGA